MQKWGKHGLITLIISSLSLLLLFQLFWLKKEYEEQKTFLRKETDNIFQKTVLEIQDSVLQKYIKILPDSLNQNVPLSIFRSIAKSNRFISENGNENNPPQSPKIRIFVKAKTDTFKKMDRVSNFNFTNPKTNSQIIIQLQNDSIHLPEVQNRYQTALKKANIDLNFKIIKGKISENAGFDTMGVLTAPVFVGMPMQVFSAVFPNYRAYIFQKIIPQILFSIFLLGITAVSFYWVYQSFLQQKHLTELKNDFISNVTHELKTPITTVGVAIEALSNFDALSNPEQTKEYLYIAKNELQRLSLMVDKILKMTVFEQKEWDLKLENVDLSVLTQQILSSMKLLFEKHNAQINFDTTGDKFTLKADSTHLTSVLYNLIENALKYSGTNPEIDLQIIEKTDGLQLNIQDNGIGIPPQYQGKIFDKFFRVPTGNVHDNKGYGLGLSYVASVVKRHGGTISVKSEVGKGSHFSIFLPTLLTENTEFH